VQFPPATVSEPRRGFYRAMPPGGPRQPGQGEVQTSWSVCQYIGASTNG
jgi:hypothetical protein